MFGGVKYMQQRFKVVQINILSVSKQKGRRILRKGWIK